MGWSDHDIGEVIVSEDGRTLSVGWHCHPDASVSATETATEVRLKLRVYDKSKGDCADYEDVVLRSPLGDRIVVDDATDTTIVVKSHDL